MESFVRAERPALLSFLRRRAAREEDAEDAAQESFLRLLRYQRSKPSHAWRFLLYRIAANVVIDRARRAQARQAADHVPLAVVSIPSPEASPVEVASSKQELARVRAAILELPPKCKEVFLLSRVHGMTYSEIAERCGISVKTVKKHVYKAIARCMAKAERGG